MTPNIVIRPAMPDEYGTLAEFFYLMWLDNGMSDKDFSENWKDITVTFMKQAETYHQGRAFAGEENGRLVGAAQCLQSHSLYPQALKPDVRTDGYIWGVYVAPTHRRQGLATQLTEACMSHLKAIGCTRMILHASPTGKPVYEGLGFNSTNEMRVVM